LYSYRGQVGDRGFADVAAVRWPQVPGPVRAMVVVVRDILGQDRAQVLRQPSAFSVPNSGTRRFTAAIMKTAAWPNAAISTAIDVTVPRLRSC
jgi:hypothetical protein